MHYARWEKSKVSKFPEKLWGLHPNLKSVQVINWKYNYIICTMTKKWFVIMPFVHCPDNRKVQCKKNIFLFMPNICKLFEDFFMVWDFLFPKAKLKSKFLAKETILQNLLILFSLQISYDLQCSQHSLFLSWQAS